MDHPPPESFLRYAGEEKRYSTCSSVAWLNGHELLLAINVQTHSLQTYQYSDGKFIPFQRLDNDDGLQLNRPGDIHISDDEQFLLITSLHGPLRIFRIEDSKTIKPRAVASIKDILIHNARFSPDDRFIVYVSMGKEAKIATYKVEKRGNRILHCLPVQIIPNPYAPLVPKAIAFTHDSRFVAIGYCTQVENYIKPDQRGLITIHRYRAKTGVIERKPIFSTTLIGKQPLISIEGLAFAPDSSILYAVDQLNNRVTAHAFDLETGGIGKSWIALKSPEAELNIPHGISFSLDGQFLAVTNGKDDKITIYPYHETLKKSLLDN